MNAPSTRTDTRLGPRFRGRPATVGARLASTTIDLTLLIALLIGVYVLTGSTVWVAVAALDLLGLAWIWQSRAGLSPAHLILGLRTSHQDKPWSPGVGRATARGVVHGLGILAGGLGAWVIAGTSAFDPTGRGRTWADRAAGTVVVKVPPREPTPQRQIPAVAPNLGIVQAAQPTRHSETPHWTGVSQPPAGVSPLPAGVSQLPGAASVPQAAPAVVSGALMLAFDTGQREYLAGGSVAVLGRNPTAIEPTDTRVQVTDPDGTVSKNHLRIEHTRDGVWLTDLGSTNGTVVLTDTAPTTPLPPQVRTLLAEGERVRIGQRAFTISLMVAEN